jgi:hypothetical protein
MPDRGDAATAGPKGGTAERLIASGRMRPGKGDLLELGEPLEHRGDGPLPSEVLAGAPS